MLRSESKLMCSLEFRLGGEADGCENAKLHQEPSPKNGQSVHQDSSRPSLARRMRTKPPRDQRQARAASGARRGALSTIRVQMRIALAQINTTVGDLEGNTALILRTAREAAERGAELAVFPELAINGYPPRALVEKESFLDRTEEQLQRLASETAGLDLALICGYAGRSHSPTGKRAANCAAVIERGEIVFRQTKMLLPTYDVFDEARYFVPGERESLFAFRGRQVALTICEDAWNDKQFWERRLYRQDPVEDMARAGAQVLISINASPYHMHKRAQRREIFANTARRFGLPVVYVNQVGGNDDLIFDGRSMAADPRGRIIAAAVEDGSLNFRRL